MKGAVHFRWGQIKRFIWITPTLSASANSGVDEVSRGPQENLQQKHHYLELKVLNCSTRSISSMRCTRLLRMVFGGSVL